MSVIAPTRSKGLSLATFRRLLMAAAVVWTAIVGLSVAVNVRGLRQQAINLAIHEARANFAKDMAFRRWATRHGGVYVPPTEKTPPNPWLAHIPDRDVVTTSGKRLTLMNPAYMLRQVIEEFASLGRSHITSLNPRNPANAPDAWEQEALGRLGAGEAEVSEIVAKPEGEELRLIRPMLTEPGCLKCHADQGYKVGDVRGGIAVTVPLAPLFASVERQRTTLLAGHGGLWLLGLVGIVIGGRDGGRRIRRQQAAIAALAESEERYRVTLDLVAVGIANVGLDGTWLTVNPRLCEIVGVPAEELIGTRFQDITHPDDVASNAEIARKLAEGGTVGAFETRYTHRSGAVIWVSITASLVRVGGRADHFITVIEDITQRKLAEEELRLTKFAVDHIHDGVSWLDADGRFLYVNDALCRMHGLSRDQLLSRRVTDFSVDHPSSGWPDHWAELREKGALVFEIDTRTGDGTVFPVEVSANLLRFEGREFNVSFVRDIRERRQNEINMRRSMDELVRSNAELERFAYIASHDLQEPLRTVTSYAQLLERRLDARLEADERELLGFMVDGAHRMHDLVRDLLSYSQVSSRAEVFRPLDLSRVVAGVLGNLAALIEDTGAVVRVGALPVVDADRSQMQMLFQNLIGNALKFRRPGIPPEVVIEAVDEGETVTIAVADNGIGIDPAYRDDIFVIFKRLHTQAAYPGTGIGLAVCKRIAERHHGHIWVEAAEGGGSVFRVRLPKPAGTA